MANAEQKNTKEYTSAERREMLEDAARRLKEARAAKKRDAKIHAENMADIEQEIEDILVALDEQK